MGNSARGSIRAGRNRLRLLLASSSVAALLVGGGTPAAFAACVNGAGSGSGYDHATGTVACIQVKNTSFTGNITNEGTIRPSGIGFINGTMSGSILSTGVINGGISIDGTSKIVSTGIAIKTTGSTFTSGIANAGTISAHYSDILVESASTFTGSISNSGTISAGRGIFVLDVAQFGSDFAVSGIANSGTIAAGLATGIVVGRVSTFLGNINNSGTISAAFSGINVFGVSTFVGNISNSGTISAGGAGIRLGFKTSGGFAAGLSTFTGNIVNSGTITAGGVGIQVGLKTGGGFIAGVSSFTGNISNSGKITAKTGILIAPGVAFGAASAIVNSGAITGTAGTAIDASNASSAVTINQNGGTITGRIKLSANSDVLNIAAGSIAGNIVGKGTLDTVNFAPGASNTFTYGSSYGFSGIHQANVTSGTVVLNGANSATSMTVRDGGTLAGTGTITSSININTGGTLAPGTPGTAGTTLGIVGALSLSVQADYLDTIGTSTASAAAITGTATLDNAVVTVATGSTVKAGTKYTILTDTSGGLGGSNTFNPSVTYSGMVGTLSYAADDVFLTFGAAPPPPSPPAGCYTGPFAEGYGYTNPAGHMVACVKIANTNFSGDVSNAGTISPGGVTVTNSSITGQFVDTGVINGGLLIDRTSTITGGRSSAAIRITGPTFTGGISNAGTIGTGYFGTVAAVGTADGIYVANVTQFGGSAGGGISNGGTIWAHATGTGIYLLHVSNFAGGISNSGMIDGGIAGILVDGVSTFLGGISNSGTISAAEVYLGVFVPTPVPGVGIAVDNVAVFGSSTAGGGIVNSGNIEVIGLGGAGIAVAYISTFWGGITNSGSGTITANSGGISLASVRTFTGNISNSGMITAASGTGILLGFRIGSFVEAGVSTFNGNIVNSGTISAKTGISIIESTINGAIIDTGTILATGQGILIDSASKITAATAAIKISGPTFTGGIANAGMLSAGNGGPGNGIEVEFVSNFAGGISNSGTISGLNGGNGIVVELVSSFGGNVSNSGKISADYDGIAIGFVTSLAANIDNSRTISAGNVGIALASVPTFTGNIANSGTVTAKTAISVLDSNITGAIIDTGTILATGQGIAIDRFSKISAANTAIEIAGPTFTGGISNAGRISAGTFAIAVGNVATFSGGITNSGTLSAGHTGIAVAFVSSFTGNISNSGTITAGLRGIVLAAVTNFTGVIVNSGSGSVTAKTAISIADSGITGGILNSGSITGTGGTAIDVSGATSAVIIFQTGGLISGAINLSPNADLLSISGGTINGNIVGSGTKDTIDFALGAGGAFTYGVAYGFSTINQVNVNSGTVTLAGTNSATNVAVISGAVLKIGDGTDPASFTAANVFNQGLVIQSPHATIHDDFYNYGTFTVAGSLFANVINTGSFTIEPGGVWTGAFLVDSGTFVDDGTWNKTPVAIGSGYTLSGNQQSVAGGLSNYINNVSPLPANFLPLFEAGNPANVLSQFSGEAATGAERAAFELTNEFMGLMLDPFVDGRGGAVSGHAMGFAPDEQTSLPPDVALAYASILKAPPKPVSFDQRWSSWGAAYGGSSATNGDPIAGSHDVSAQTYGFASGMDYRVSPYTVVGFAAAGSGTSWGLANALGSGRSDAAQFGVYGVSWLGPVYLAGALAFTNHWFTTNRSALGDQLTANFDGQSYSARFEGGYRVAVLPRLGVTPYGAVQVQDFYTTSYSESDVTGGGLGLSYAAMNATDVRSELGARFDDPTLLYGKPLILFGRVAWAHDWVSTPSLNAVFEALPGASFTVNGAPIPHDSALTSAGAQLFLSANWSLIAKFDGEFADGSQTYTGSGTLRYTW
jgi:uncharacterized protein YhjY with autotransporter beta-barrel domain